MKLAVERAARSEHIKQKEELILEVEAQIQLIVRREQRARLDRAVAIALLVVGSLLSFFTLVWGLVVVSIGLWRTIHTQDQLRRHRAARQDFAQLFA